MEYVSKSPNNCLKGVLQYVQNFTNIPGNEGITFMIKINCSSLGQIF